MKKILGLGSIGIVFMSTSTLVSCSLVTKSKKIIAKKHGVLITSPPSNIHEPSTTNIGGLDGSTQNNQPIRNMEYDKIRLSLQDFSSGNGHLTTDITEDPHIDYYLTDVGHSLRTFKIYNNGLFKIKIEKGLIGIGRPFSSDAKALLLAKNIANQINIGPAIKFLPKGIQILNSTNVASLGGQRGVQVSLNGASGKIFSDRDILAITSIVTHEYGHHETMWDMNHLFNKSIPSEKKLFLKYLANNGFRSIANIAVDSLSKKPSDFKFKSASFSDYPLAYSGHPSYFPFVFADKVYPFGFNELTTRIQNILSFTMSKKDVYMTGEVAIPAFLTSDETFRYYAHDSLFGTGKDDSRVQKLYEGLLKYVYGLGTNSISIKYNPNTRILDGITFTSFDAIDIDSLKIYAQNGTLLKDIKLNIMKGLFSHKKELFSTVQSTKDIYNILSTPIIPDFGITIEPDQVLTIKGFKGLTEIDISNVITKVATADVGQWYHTHLVAESKHLKIT